MTKGGAAVPVKRVTSGTVVGGTAIPVYGYTAKPASQAAAAGPAMAVYVVNASELRQNGGTFAVAGDAQAIVVYDAPSDMRVAGGNAIPVYPLNNWP